MALLAIVAVLAAAVGAHSISGADGPGQLPDRTATTATACGRSEVREACSEIEVAGRTWRYSLRRASPGTPNTALVDLGGPGTSVMSGANGLGHLPDTLPRLSADHNLLVIEEPWVLDPVPAACRAALSAYYVAMRSTWSMPDAVAGRLGSDCGVGRHDPQWGFTPQTYDAVVHAIVEREGLVLDGFVGHSWGAVRLTYLTSTTLRWATLLRPYPYAASLDDITAGRLQALASLTSSLNAQMPASSASTTVEGRSVPVERFDLATSVVELGYVDDDVVQQFGAAVVTGTRPDKVGLLSDQYWGRYGVDDLSPRMLAFWDEACPVAGASQDLVRSSSELARVVGLQFSPCQLFHERRAVRTPTGLAICVVYSKGDAVTPTADILRTYGGSNDVVLKEVGVRAHPSMEGADACMTGMRPSGA